MVNRGADISEFQGSSFKLRWLPESLYKFVIVRGAGTYRGSSRKYIDSEFERFYKEAKEVEFPIGVYYYSTATTYDEGKEEANFLYNNCLKGKQFEYPIFIDCEENNTILGIQGFCETLEKLGYFVGVYCNLSMYNSLDKNILKKYCLWLAYWGTSKPKIELPIGIWQYANNLKVGGITTDGDYGYQDFPTIIKENGLNGYATPPVDDIEITFKKGDVFEIIELSENKITIEKKGKGK